MNPFVSRLLLILVLALSAAITFVWWSGATEWQAPRAVPPDESLISVPPSKFGGSLTYERDGILERPLFAADRRPMAVELAPAVASEEPVARNALDGVRLTGILGEGASGIAIIDDAGKSRRLVAGDRVGSWRLDGVDSFAAVFVDGGGRVRRLELPAMSGLVPPAGPGQKAARGARGEEGRKASVRERLKEGRGAKPPRKGERPQGERD